MSGVSSTGFQTVQEPHTIDVRFTPSALDVRTQLQLEAGMRRVFDALLHVAAWWPHRGQPGSRVALEPRVGGRFFESWDDGCGLLLGHVCQLVPPSRFAIDGSLGLAGPVTGRWSVTLEPLGHRQTLLSGRHQAFGAIGDEERSDALGRWNACYEALARYVEPAVIRG